ncbi:Transcriptional activator hap5 [Batrachochytrium dendrobatidis]|nr:CCAAT- binding transcription factor component [Batrachochytrium dendrobatidis]KAK5673421.1 Transcriptional activator hap5 [Batrachochytrium dendrobatidis]
MHLQSQDQQGSSSLVDGTDIAAVMAATAAAASAAANTTTASTANSNAQVHLIMQNFWARQLEETIRTTPDFKAHPLPLARIKKVMKADEDVKQMMISAEAPLIFGKACEIFILELTLRSWMHTEENKRRTLQKSDVAMASSQSDMYDFLIDIVPRDEVVKTHLPVVEAASDTPVTKAAASKEFPVQYPSFTTQSFNTEQHQPYMSFGQSINQLYQNPSILGPDDGSSHRTQMNAPHSNGSFWNIDMPPRMGQHIQYNNNNADSSEITNNHPNQL